MNTINITKDLSQIISVDTVTEKLNKDSIEPDEYLELPPYDWGNVDPLSLGKPVHYIVGKGLFVIETEESNFSFVEWRF